MTQRRHFIIPDVQAKEGVPLDHCRWVAAAVDEYKPDRIIHLGDHWDFQSVSRHSSPGSKEKENQRVLKDIEAGNKALEIISSFSHKPKSMHILRGNHEHRLQRYVDENPVLEGILGNHLLNDKELGWTPVEYLNGSPQAINLDGIYYSHYFSHPNTGKPIGGTASYKLGTVGAPFVMGHVQGLDIGTRQFATGDVVRGIVAGSCYIHDEPYKGMANKHWRGVVVLNEVERGRFSIMDLSLDYLCRKYEGMSLPRFLQRKYKNAKDRFSIART